MALKIKIRLIISAAFVVAGIVLIPCGMNVFRALYLILAGVFLFLTGFYDYVSIETPRGVRFWLMKVLANIMSMSCTLLLVDFTLPRDSYSFRGLVIWLGLCIVIGILCGTLDYFYNRTDCDEAEFAARKKRLQEIGEQYDKVVKEMDSEKQ